MGEPPLFAAPVKHSVTIAGHRTSISLEPVFWDALRNAASARGVALNALVASIDGERIAALQSGMQETAPNLASAIRCWLWAYYCK